MTSNAEKNKTFLERIHARDEDAMTEFVRNELPRVYNLCLRLTSNPTDAADLCQDSFVRAVRNINSFKGESSVSTWLYRIAINTWKNRVRSEKRRKFSSHVSISGYPSSESDDSEVSLQLEDPGPSPEDIAARNQEIESIYSAMNELDPEEKSILILRDVEGRSYEEIAEMLGLNLGTVKSRLSRARLRLREIYHRKGGPVA